MFRNREILYTVIWGIAIASLAMVIDRMGLIDGIYIIIGEGVLFFCSLFLFCVYRYGRIKDLSAFLRRAQNERIPLEAADQMEGELDVLKTEFYKILTKYYAQEEQLSKDKKFLADTISDVSHQLKTPMTSMNIMIEQLRDDSLSHEKRLEFTNSLHKQMHRMDWLLSAMLTMSRLDAGAIILKKDTIRIKDLLEKSVDHLLVPMELHGQQLLIQGDTSVAFKGDLQWSSEAISNILKNCMEHTPDNGVITINVEGGSLCTDIRIQDQGGGINERDLPHIFERFYKGENASPDSAGIGLALARRLITEQNGTIEIETIYGESTVFLIRFYHHNI